MQGYTAKHPSAHTHNLRLGVFAATQELEGLLDVSYARTNVGAKRNVGYMPELLERLTGG